MASWAASPAGNSPDTAQLNNNTVREIVHVTVGGSQVRIRLSNEFGRQPLIVGAAHIAIRESGASIVATSDRALTFSGNTGVTVDAGADAVSDPVALAVPAMTDVAVSIFIKGSTRLGTAHPFALQTSYVGPGDGTSVADMPFTKTLSSWPFLSSVDVAETSSAPGNVVVAFGDSLTNGANSSPDCNRRWVDHLAARMVGLSQTTAVINAGISGNRLLHDGDGGSNSLYGKRGTARFDRDVLSVAGVKTTIVLLGTNDIVQPGSVASEDEAVSVGEIIAGLRSLAEQAHAKGVKIVLGTITPFYGPDSAFYSAEKEKKRQALNDWIRTTTTVDGVIDFDLALRDPDLPSRLLPQYDSGDHLHPNDAGHQAMADAIDASLLTK